MVSDDEFETELGYAPLIRKYREQGREIEDAVSRDYLQQFDGLRRLKLAGLEREKAHRDLLNLCVYPFTETGRGSQELGYRFLYGSPLSELDKPPFDFLIARLLPADKPAILLAGEGKSIVGSPIQTVNEVKKKHMVLEANIEHVLETYLGQPRNRDYMIEPIIAVDSVDANTMMNAVVEAGTDIKVWHGPATGPESISIAVPPSSTTRRERYLHADSRLNSLMNRLPSVRRAFDVWPKSHTLIQMGALIPAAHTVERGMVVRTGSLDGVLERDLFYLPEAIRKDLARGILGSGVTMGFLEHTMVADEYRVIARGLRRDVLEESLRDKWIKWQIGEDEAAEMARRKEVLRKEIRTERATVRTMDDY